MEDRIPVYLNKEEAELFKTFRKYQNIWEEIFKIKGGKAILFFDNEGILRQTHTENTIQKYSHLTDNQGRDIIK